MDKRPRERSASTEAGGEKPLTQEEAREAMERFKSVTRDLLNVPRERIAAEERRFKQRRRRQGSK